MQTKPLDNKYLLINRKFAHFPIGWVLFYPITGLLSLYPVASSRDKLLPNLPIRRLTTSSLPMPLIPGESGEPTNIFSCSKLYLLSDLLLHENRGHLCLFYREDIREKYMIWGGKSHHWEVIKDKKPSDKLQSRKDSGQFSVRKIYLVLENILGLLLFQTLLQLLLRSFQALFNSLLSEAPFLRHVFIFGTYHYLASFISYLAYLLLICLPGGNFLESRDFCFVCHHFPSTLNCVWHIVGAQRLFIRGTNKSKS